MKKILTNALFFLIVLFQTLILVANPRQYSTKSLSINDGLLSNKINVVFQDSEGFIWFGSQSGLSRYDGNIFLNYEYEPHKENCLSNSNIEDIIEDNTGNLYIATNNGLNIFQKSKQKFSYFPITRNGEEKKIKINALVIDSLGNLIIGSTEGLFIYNLQQKRFIDSISGPVYNDEVHSLCVDQYKNIWVGTNKNIYCYNYRGNHALILKQVLFEDNTFNQIHCIKPIESSLIICTNTGIHLYSQLKEKYSKVNISHEEIGLFIGDVTDLYVDTENTTWIGTVNGIYYKKHHNWGNNDYKKNIEVKVSTYKTYFSVKNINPDNLGNIWINSPKEGVALLYPSNANVFKFHKYDDDNWNSLGSNYINTVAVDSNENLFIGTDGGGLNSYNPITGNYLRFNTSDTDFTNIDVSIMSSYVDKDNTLWFGTYDRSLYNYSPETGLTDYSSIIIPIKESGSNPIKALTEHNNTIVVGTGGSGFYLMNKKDRTIKNYSNKKGEISNDYVTCVYVDRKNRLWIGTYWGLNLFEIKSKTNRQFTYDKYNAKSISNNTITSINEDAQGNLWIGTLHGLNKLNDKDFTFKNITKQEGLPSNVISAFESDENNQLWISTQRGLCRLNIETNVITEFKIKTKKGTIEFAANASSKSKSGTLFFGSNEGLIQFNPNNIKALTQNNKLVLTDIKLFNQSILSSGDIITNRDNNTPLNLTLNHKQSVLSIDFTSLNFINSSNDEFAYYLEGFDSKWQKAGSKRSATYTNLKAGEYTFKVQQPKQKNENEAIVNIYVLPPFWKTWYAFLIYAILFIIALHLYRKYSLIRVNVKNDLLIQKMQRAKDQEINDIKLKFFTNISHEFCTPLTLIIAPLEKLKADSKSNNLYDLILKNAHRLLRLIDQLMEFRMIESDTLALNKQNDNIVSFSYEIFSAFDELATKKEIKYNFSSEQEDISLEFDKDKMEKILYNLISNAFKYSPNKSEISVSLFIEHDYLTLNIQDTGVGISKEHLPYIFDRFYNSKNENQIKDNPEQNSFGVGLALTKTLVELHKGKIEVSSQQGIGTTFKVKFPAVNINKQAVIQHASANKNVLSSKVKNYLNYDFYTHKNTSSLNENDNSEKEQSILIVEDNNDIRAFLIDLLSEKYSIFDASNGKGGLTLASKHDIDLIITDVLMPVMGGIEFCKNIKNDIQTSHIPILMLTALHAKDHILEGLKSGASDYITKPFDPLILNTKIENILNAQANLQNKFKKNLIIEPKEITTNTKDAAFLKRAIEIIDANLSNEKLGVEMLAKELNLTTISLYRKLKKICALSSNEFIRSIKLKKAATLLKTDPEISINEVSFMAGFHDVQYFRQCFKKEFGINPNEYKKTDL